MADVTLRIVCAGMINGEIITARGRGASSAERGSLAIELEFSTIPAGFSIHCASLWTACCSSLAFAIERQGAVNMLRLARGRYQCRRTFDFGRHGTYDYMYEIRLIDDDQMRATGVLHGNLWLPEIASVEPQLTELMVPRSRREVSSFSSATFHASSGEAIPVKISGRYLPLADDVDEWHCDVENQVRKSLINVREVADTKLALDYTTVIQRVGSPVMPA